MVDPVSIVGLVGQVADLLSRAYSYGKLVHDAKNDMRKLYTELLGLKGVLEQLQELDLASTEPNIANLIRSAQFCDALSTTSQLVARLIDNLNKKQTSSRRMNAFLWPWVKDDVKADIQDLERMKAWFIMMMMAENATQMEVLVRDSNETLTIVREEQTRRKLREDGMYERREWIKEWIQPFSPKLLYAKAAEKRMESTGSWFLDGEFRVWKEGGESIPRVLWVRGKSGSGKTVLHATAVGQVGKHCQENPEVGFAFFYCSFNDRESQKPINILGSIAYQLSEQYPKALDSIEQLRKSGETLSVDALLKLISQYVQYFDTFYILVDAINESFSFSNVFDMLLRLVANNPNVRLLATAISSCAHWVEDLQLEGPPNISEVNMGTAKVEQDIDHYITTRISEEPLLRRLSAETQSELREKVLHNAKGMFRYAQCQLDSLSASRTAKIATKAVYNLPKDIYEVYERILSSIPDSDKVLARESLFILSAALRPLTMVELAEAVVLEDGDTHIDEESRLSEPRVLLEICQGLIDYDKTTNRVTLAHSSVRSYLTSSRLGDSDAGRFSYDLLAEIHKGIAIKCLTYLLLDHFRNGCCPDEEFEKKHKDYPFLRYASRYWPLHARLSGRRWRLELLPVRLCLSFKKQKGGNFSFWVQCLMPDVPEEMIMATEPLYYASSFGLIDLADATDRVLYMQHAIGAIKK
ncbi:hypothetical protein FOQG_19268 [Fusarium oxysporum f. sp. raphani 54005]|uniref:NACHT domain-containing protein n=1 Tax=Fusarium oxysporum f. sp. raphani 54005 TaxID=1089458 RepID=X0B1H4_FUSOX|nr:hypothetical protein FOQG_19268 [Fusarium oxysporum f. sp. raphani 54005]